MLILREHVLLCLHILTINDYIGCVELAEDFCSPKLWMHNWNTLFGCSILWKRESYLLNMIPVRLHIYSSRIFSNRLERYMEQSWEQCFVHIDTNTRTLNQNMKQTRKNRNTKQTRKIGKFTYTTYSSVIFSFFTELSPFPIHFEALMLVSCNSIWWYF